MKTREIPLGVVGYSAAWLGRNRFLIVGTLQRPGKIPVLQSPGRFGPLSGLDRRFTRRKLIRENGAVLPWEEAESAGTGSAAGDIRRFSYEAELTGALCGPEALFRGHGNAGYRFFLGLALFSGVQNAAGYRVQFDRKTAGPGLISRSVFLFPGTRDLWLSAFGQGRYLRGRPAGLPVTLTGLDIPPGRMAYLQGELPRLVSACSDWWGTTLPHGELALFAWPGAGTGYGQGSSVAKAGWVALPAEFKPSGDSWLLLHELFHQWAGNAIQPKEPGLEWFFEGIACYGAYLLSLRLGMLDAAELKTLLQSSLFAAGQERNPGNPYREGMIMMHAFHRRLLASGQGTLAAWSGELFRGWRGKKLDGASLSEEMLRAAPERAGDTWLTTYLRTGKVPAHSVSEMAAALMREAGIQFLKRRYR